MPREFVVTKSTGTYADTLKAVGLASLLREIAGDETQVAVCDASGTYVIRLNRDVTEACDMSRLSVGYRYLLHEKAAKPPPGLRPEPFPYIAQREIERRHHDWRKRSGNTKARTRNRGLGEALAQVEPPLPDPRLTLFKALNSLRAGSESWNSIALAIQMQLAANMQKLVKLVIRRATAAEGIQPDANDSFAIDVKASVLQAFWPTAGKGVNRGKPDGAKLDNLKGGWVDWFDEWCRYRGVRYLLNARFLGAGRKDCKFLCLLPGSEISLDALARLADAFVAGHMFDSGHAYSDVKSDVFAVLGLAEWLVSHSEHAPRPEDRLLRVQRAIRPTQPRLREVLSGVRLAYFKSLGTGRALSNEATIHLPDWIPLTSGTYEKWRALLDEHQRVLATLREERGEEAALLLSYRDAVSRNELPLFLDFFADYGSQYMRRRDRKDYSEQFSHQNLEVLCMSLSQDFNPRIAELVKDPGFASIANAVHEATVKAQYWKGRGRQEYEIHYGLAQRWKRAVDQGSRSFVEELADFVRAYNEENAKRQEKGRPTRDSVAQPDLDAVVETISSGAIDARTVCLLLLAYGYAMTADEKTRATAARESKRTAPEGAGKEEGQ